MTRLHPPSPAMVRPLVPVLGTGLNRWLLDKHDSPVLTDWWALLRDTARKVVANPRNLQTVLKQLNDKGSPTFAWEALLHAAHPQASGTTAPKLSATEDAVLSVLANKIAEQVQQFCAEPDVVARSVQLRDALSAGRADMQVDVLSLNFDDLWVRALQHGRNDKDLQQWQTPWSARPVTVEKVRPKAAGLTIPSYYMQVDDELHVWHPHGRAASSSTMIAGLHRYTRSADYVWEAFQAFKEAERQLRAAEPTTNHNGHRLRRDVEAFVSWPAVAINAPLLLLGVGLSRDEADLWEFLHLRARNHANVDPAKRPKIWRLTCDAEKATDQAHWQSVSAGLEIHDLNLGRDWNSAWGQLLQLLRAPAGSDHLAWW